MKNANLMEEPLGCHVKYVNLASQSEHFSVVVGSPAFRQPREVTAASAQSLLHARYWAKTFVHIIEFNQPPGSLWVG